VLHRARASLRDRGTQPVPSEPVAAARATGRRIANA